MSELNQPNRRLENLVTEIVASASKIDEASRCLFAGTELYPKIQEVTAKLRNDCRCLAKGGAAPLPTVALVGALAEGKSWLARCFLTSGCDNDSIRQDIKVGQDHGQRNKRLMWFGPQKPFELEQSDFVVVSQNRMLDLGQPYVVVDTPGFTDDSELSGLLSDIAAKSAALKVLVISEQQIRDGRIADYIACLNGARILPVVKFRPESDPTQHGRRLNEPAAELQNEVRHQMQRWQARASEAVFLDPCFMPISRIYGEEEETENLMRRRLAAAMTSELGKVEHLHLSVERQIEARRRDASLELKAILQDFRERVRGPLGELKNAAKQIPDHLISELIGEPVALHAALRPRFRADWIDRTPPWLFPFRTFLGLLALTAGAWDRLIFSIAGSAPSLVLTFVQAIRNVRDRVRMAQYLRESLTGRIERRLEDQIRGKVQAFQMAVDNALARRAIDAVIPITVRFTGLEAVEVESRQIFQESIRQQRARNTTVLGFGLIGTGVFFYLLFGPLASLYRAYLAAHYRAFWKDASLWTDFPTPSMAMLSASLLLSLIPLFSIAIVAMSWCCRSRRIANAVDFVNSKHQNYVREQFQNKALRFELNDPRFDAAHILLCQVQ